MDEFLERHLHPDVDGNVFRAVDRAPESIRDQMMRAIALVDRAAGAGIIGTSIPLLVVGAGAAGVSAALRAAGQHGICTVLLESDHRAFQRQNSCGTRYLCPTQYDFPASHWTEGSFPPKGYPLPPLPWTAGYADDIAARWNNEFNARMADDAVWPFLEFHGGVRLDHGGVVQRDDQPGVVDVTWKIGGKTFSDSFGMVIFAVGFGEEDCSVAETRGALGQHFAGYPFWSTDPFEDIEGTLRDIAGLDEVTACISGAGDGALQDLLRLVYAKPAQAIFSDVFGEDPLAIDVMNRIYSIEDQAMRLLANATTGAEREGVFEWQHDRYVEVVNYVRAHGSDDLHDRMDRAFNDGGPNRPDLIHIVRRTNYYTQCYALNRFIVLLLESQPPSWLRLHTGRTTHIAPVGTHVCAGDPEACFGQKHQVTVEGDTPFEADIVIVRHGANPFDDRGDRRRREDATLRASGYDVLPYYLIRA